jgi:hypothetical protein
MGDLVPFKRKLSHGSGAAQGRDRQSPGLPIVSNFFESHTRQSVDFNPCSKLPDPLVQLSLEGGNVHQTFLGQVNGLLDVSVTWLAHRITDCRIFSLKSAHRSRRSVMFEKSIVNAGAVIDDEDKCKLL